MRNAECEMLNEESNAHSLLHGPDALPSLEVEAFHEPCPGSAGIPAGESRCLLKLAGKMPALPGSSAMKFVNQGSGTA